jgi:hypothetical protein
MAKTPLEVRREKRSAAFPEVKRLVQKYGRTIIAGCLSQIKEKEKALRKVADLKKELARLEKSV